jgi:hypothetical protein
MARFLNFIKEYELIIFTCVLTIAIFLFLYFEYSKVDNDGIITVAKVIRYEAAADGSELHIEIYFKQKIYKTSLNQTCQFECIGKYFFIKISTEHPTEFPIFYDDKIVPDCIIKKVKYFNGWKKAPTCDDLN